MTKQTMKDRARAQLGALGSAAAEGVAAAAIVESGDLLLDLVHEIAKEEGAGMVFTIATSHPIGREVVKTAAAVAVHSLCTYTDFIPKEELVARVAAIQVRESMRASTQWLVMRLKTSKPIARHFEKLAEIGSRLPDSTATVLDFGAAQKVSVKQ